MTPNNELPTSHGDELLARLPAETAATLDDAQKKAISHAADEVAKRMWAPGHAVDIRFSFPLARYFVTIVAGHERRDDTRLNEQRRSYPLRRIGNFLFIGVAATVFYAAAAMAFLVYSAVFEF
jgi:hypothetical protein